MRRITSIGLLLLAGCVHRRGDPSAEPLTLLRSLPPVRATQCLPAPGPTAPTGRTPGPIATGALSLIDVRGDDRLALAGQFAVTWSADSEQIITATREHVLRWSRSSGLMLSARRHGAPLQSVQQIVVGPAAGWALVAGRVRPPGTSSPLSVVRLLRLDGEEAVKEFAPSQYPLFLTADGSSALDQGSRWDLTTGTHVTLPRAPHELHFLPDGHRAVFFSRESGQYTPTLWDVEQGAPIHRFEPVRLPDGVAISGDGKRLALLRDSLQIYSLETLERLARISGVPSDGLVGLSFDGARCVVSSVTCVKPGGSGGATNRCTSPSLTVWDVEQGKPLASSPTGAGDAWQFTGDGRHLTGPPNRLVEFLLRADDLSPVRSGSVIRSVSPGGEYVLSQTNGHLTLSALAEVEVPTFDRAARVIARSSDGAWTALLDPQGLLRVEGPSSCVQLSMGTHEFGVKTDDRDALDLSDLQLEFSSDGLLLFVLTSLGNNLPRFRALESATGAERWSLGTRGHAGAELSGGELLLQGHGLPELLRFDARTGELTVAGQVPRLSYRTTAAGPTIEVRDMHGSRVSHLGSRFSSHVGNQVGAVSFFSGDLWFSLWDPAHPGSVLDRPAGAWVTLVAHDPSGTHWVVGHRSGSVRVFTGTAPGRTIETGHAGPVTSLVFTPDGSLLSASEDGSIALTSLSTGERLGQARIPHDGVRSMWLSSNGAELRVETARALRVRLSVAAQRGLSSPP